MPGDFRTASEMERHLSPVRKLQCTAFIFFSWNVTEFSCSLRLTTPKQPGLFLDLVLLVIESMCPWLPLQEG